MARKRKYELKARAEAQEETRRRIVGATVALHQEVGPAKTTISEVAKPGDLVFKPRGVPHAFWNAGDAPARLLEIISPAPFSNYFAELEPLFMRPEGPDFAAIAALQERYGLTMDFDSIETLIEREGLAPLGA